MYCLVVAKGLTGRELLLRLEADPADLFTPQDEDEANEFLWAGMEDYWSWGAARAGEANGWAFALEPASIWAASPRRLERASAGTSVVCCWYADGNGELAYWQDGSLLTKFQTPTPQERSGADPDHLLEAMGRVGLAGEETSDPRLAGLALAHEVTGMALSQQDTMLVLTGKLPADDEECDDADGDGDEPLSGGVFDYVGGPVGEPPVVRVVVGEVGALPRGAGAELDHRAAGEVAEHLRSDLALLVPVPAEPVDDLDGVSRGARAFQGLATGGYRTLFLGYPLL